MKTFVPSARRLVASLALILLSNAALAQIVDLGGQLERGKARPPLFLNLGPFSTSSTAPPYTPQQVRHAYGFDNLISSGTDGRGQIIAIIDAFGSSSAQSDLDAFCSYFGIASTKLVIAQPQGKPRKNRSWAIETSLDVQWAHAIAPSATILLVEAIDNSTDHLLGAVDYAVGHGASVVSMSWGGAESSDETSSDAHFSASGVTFVASSGDNGEGVEWPAASPNVVAVGGTSLYLSSSGNYGSEAAWSGSGGGISAYEPLPSWQAAWQDAGNTSGGWSTTRGVPDVSYLADPNTGVYVVYRGFLYSVGGTSVGAPQWAALVALANQASGKTLGSNASAIYAAAAKSYSSLFHDVSSGKDGSDPDDQAIANFDLVTGLGSPKANALVPALP